MINLTSGNQNSLAGKYLAFAISKERYAFEILKVQEIIKVTHITPVPKCPKHLKGVINLRGKIIPVIDLRLKFGIESIPYNDRTCIIVININRGDQKIGVGVIVDMVLEVINFMQHEIETAPNYGTKLDTQFIVGMGKKDDQLNILIDIAKVINAEDATSIAELSKQ